jgi:pimeloyl-ACP methyl ester carboxylesterase
LPFATNPNDGVRIYYEVEGDGPPLVLVHGFSANHLHWRTSGIAEALRGAYTLIAIDARGNGLSDKPYEPEAYVIQNRVADIICVIDALGHSQVNFCGYSNGAEDGFGLAALAPERGVP